MPAPRNLTFYDTKQRNKEIAYRRWCIEFEHLFSRKLTLSSATWASRNDQEQTLRRARPVRFRWISSATTEPSVGVRKWPIPAAW